VIHIALIGGVPGFSGGDNVFPARYVPSLGVVYAAWVAMLALLYALLSLWKSAHHEPRQ